jgi:hypothetical protein
VAEFLDSFFIKKNYYERFHYTTVFRHFKKRKYIQTDIRFHFIQILSVFLRGHVRDVFEYGNDFSDIVDATA